MLVFDNYGWLFGFILFCCLVEYQFSVDFFLMLVIVCEVGNFLFIDSLLVEFNCYFNQMYGLLESMDDGVMVWNEQGVLQFFNVQVVRLLYFDVQVSQGKNIVDLVIFLVLLCCVIKYVCGLNYVEVIFESQYQFVDVVIILKLIVEV